MPERFTVTLLDLLVLVRGLYDGKAHSQVGFEAANVTFDEFTSKLNKQHIAVKVEDLQACLWSLTLLNENDAPFWHPHKLTLAEFINRIVPNRYKYDPKLCLIEERGRKK